MSRLRLATLSILCLGLMGCETTSTVSLRQEPTIRVARSPVETSLPVLKGGHLGAEQKTQIKAFLNHWHERGQGPLFVTLPTVAPDVRQAFMADLTALARNPAGIRVVEVQADTGTATLRFEELVAIGPDCAPDAGTLYQSKNEPSPSFGCATKRNFAAMIANPADLVSPAISGPANATRGAMAVQRLRAGQLQPGASNSEAGSGLTSDLR